MKILRVWLVLMLLWIGQASATVGEEPELTNGEVGALSVPSLILTTGNVVTVALNDPSRSLGLLGFAAGLGTSVIGLSEGEPLMLAAGLVSMGAGAFAIYRSAHREPARLS
ncbi:MAG TPA: hypothetical protein VFU38_01125, partial [Candidatus Krumholzibacteria bacterium]|nr:hypothetical protein [Candidatus Krumholzibacteria bacterium]